MAMPIIPRLVRDRLYFQTADVRFFTLVQATSVWVAADAARLRHGPGAGAANIAAAASVGPRGKLVASLRAVLTDVRQLFAALQAASARDAS